MGRSRRPRPRHLSAKLREIRRVLRLSLAEMARALEHPHPAHISGFEKGVREPSLPLIVKYAEVFGCSTDYLINDQLELPAKRSKKVVKEQ